MMKWKRFGGWTDKPSQFTAVSPFTFDPLNATVEVDVQWVLRALPSPVILIRG